MEYIKYYSPDDLSFGFNLKNIEKRIYSLDLEKNDYTINQILEFYNICLYIDSGAYLNSWSEEYKENLKKINKSLNKIIAIYFSNLKEEYLIDLYSQVYFDYTSDFWNILNKYINKIEISDSAMEHFLESSKIYIFDILACKNIVYKFSFTIKSYMIKDVIESTHVLIEKYIICDKKHNIEIPKDLSLSEKRNIIEKYLMIDNINVNYLNLLLEAPLTKEFNLDDKLKLKIRKRRDEEVEKLFSSSAVFSSDYIVSFDDNMKEEREINITSRKYEFKYSNKWIENNLDYPTLFNNFIYLFDYVDNEFRWSCISRKNDMSTIEEVFSPNAKSNYINHSAFKSINTICFMQMQGYYNVLKKNDVRVEKMVEWFFNDYLLNEFNISGYKVAMPSESSTYLEKCRFIFPEIEGILKKYNLYVEDKEIDLDLLEISGTPLLYENVKSLLRNKYVYAKNTITEQLMVLLFSDQCVLFFIERIDRNEYNCFYDLLLNEDVYVDDVLESDLYLIDKLVEYQLVIVNDKKIQLKDKYFALILKDLYYCEVISYWNVSKKIREKIDELFDMDLIYFGNSLFSNNEKDYINYYFNNKDFSNSLGLRNKYMHGAQKYDENVYLNDYMISLRILILIIIKINAELCTYDSEEYKRILFANTDVGI